MYGDLFHGLGIGSVTGLRPDEREEADAGGVAAALKDATGVFLTGGTLTCALHLSRFDLDSGEPLDPPADQPLAVYPVVVEDGRILIEVGDGPLEVIG
jgi:hypothetical protein